jgi:hypothetical protein
MRRVLILLTFLTLSTTAFAATPEGFAWGDQPVNPGYAPNAAFAYNSTGGAIRIQRTAVGMYKVTFFGLAAAGAGHKSNVQVTAYDGRNTCNVQNWSGSNWSGSPDLVVSVNCFYIPDGSLKDSKYTVLVTYSP